MMGKIKSLQKPVEKLEEKPKEKPGQEAMGSDSIEKKNCNGNGNGNGVRLD